MVVLCYFVWLDVTMRNRLLASTFRSETVAEIAVVRYLSYRGLTRFVFSWRPWWRAPLPAPRGAIQDTRACVIRAFLSWSSTWQLAFPVLPCSDADKSESRRDVRHDSSKRKRRSEVSAEQTERAVGCLDKETGTFCFAETSASFFSK